jgi:uncharacterized repeat protein (TIGR01451 family)
VTITITAKVIARNATLTNSASVSSSTPDPNPANNMDSASVTVLGTADLAIAKTGVPANPTPGGADTFTLTVSNNGPDTASGVVVNDALPSQFTATSALIGGATPCTVIPAGPGGTVVCVIGSLASGATVTITISGTLAGGSAGQSAVDAATVSSNTGDPDLSNNTDTLSQLIGSVADVSITKTALLSLGPPAVPVTNPLQLGGTFIYALHVTNNGPSDAGGVSVSDTLPAGMMLVAPVPGGCTPGAGSVGPITITCPVGTLTAGTSQDINLQVLVTSGTAAALTNTATVSSTTLDPNMTNNSASATVGVGAVANLALAKSVSPQTANVGDLVTYTFAVSNDISIGEAGGAPNLTPAAGVVTDTLPTGLQFVSSSSGCTASSGTVTCPVSTVVQGLIVTVSFRAQITSGPGTTIQNTASVATVGGIPDFNPADNTDHAALVVNPQADLSLAKTVSSADPSTDDAVEYALTVHNAGPNDATGVTIHDSLPAGLDFIDASPGCDNQNGMVTCDVGAVANGQSVSVTIDARTTAALAGTAVGNLATVSGNELDPNPANNQATATITVQPLVDLELTKFASNPTPAAGSTVTYTLTLVNHGPSPATGVTITDPLPSGLSFVSANAGQGTCGASGHTITCGLGTLVAGGTAVATVTALVGSSAIGTSVQNTATASADEPDRAARAGHRKRLDPGRRRPTSRNGRPRDRQEGQPHDQARRRAADLHDHRRQPWPGDGREPNRHRHVLQAGQDRVRARSRRLVLETQPDRLQAGLDRQRPERDDHDRGQAGVDRASAQLRRGRFADARSGSEQQPCGGDRKRTTRKGIAVNHEDRRSEHGRTGPGAVVYDHGQLAGARARSRGQGLRSARLRDDVHLGARRVVPARNPMLDDLVAGQRQAETVRRGRASADDRRPAAACKLRHGDRRRGTQANRPRDGRARRGAAATSTVRGHGLTALRPASLTTIVAAVLGALAAGAPAAAASPHPGAPTVRAAWVAHIVIATPGRSEPAAGRRQTTTSPIADGGDGPVALLVLGVRRLHDGTTWLRVLLPQRPNGTSVWIDSDLVQLSRTPWRIEVSLEERTVSLLHDGRLTDRWLAVVGKPSAPTPTGLFSVYQRVRQPNPNAFLGTWALLLSGFSNALREFDGGPGRFAIHGRGGTSLLDPLGTARSHGCIRINNTAVDVLASDAAEGTPVQIT